MDFDDHVKKYFELLKNGKSEAQEYYNKYLLDDVCKKFTGLVQKFKKYDYIIMSVGFSPEPLIMWIRALQPKKVFFICDDDTIKYIDYIVEKTNLKLSQCQYQSYNGLTITDVYKQIKEFIERQNLYDQLDKVVIDITGGKKSTVSGCALAANYLGIDTVYVDYSKYQHEYRKPVPGTECPVLLTDPAEVFGDKYMKQAFAKFNSGDFLGAKEIFDSIRVKVANPKKYEMYEALAEGYYALECMKFSDAYQSISQAINISQQYDIGGLDIKALQEQINFIQPLTTLKSNVTEVEMFSDVRTFWHAIIYSMSICCHYFNQGKYDLTALLSYRCLEMFIQYLLYKNGINASNATYDHLDKDDLLCRINNISKTIRSEHGSLEALPNKISLITGMMIIKAIDKKYDKDIKLQVFVHMTTLRNKSRFAHGFNILEEKDAKLLYDKVQDLIDTVWKEEQGQIGYECTIEIFIEKFKFIKLL